MEKKLKYIELFAGCGGMSLGLENAGFELYFANELSPMAGETFAYNILKEDLEQMAKNKTFPSKVKWIRSNYSLENFQMRLRENPFETRTGEYSDIDSIHDILGNLLIGDIDILLEFLESRPEIIKQIRNDNIDLVSGGPPCQGFSLAGKRFKDDQKNLLPLSFAKFVGLVQPKSVLLENVKGIITPFIENGNKYYAWIEVVKAFVLEGYVPICIMLNSKYFGVAQNRPRFIMQAFRKDVFDNIYITNKKNNILELAYNTYKLVYESKNDLDSINEKYFKYFDVEENPELFNGFLLPKITNQEGSFITVNESIDNIRRTEISYKISDFKKGYNSELNKLFINKRNDNQFVENHEPRKHHFTTKARFRFYQVINEFQNGLKEEAVKLFAGVKIEEDKKKALTEAFMNYYLYFKLNAEEVYKKPKTLFEVNELLKAIPTKKHTQRALIESDLAPAQLTIPDDLCHYHMGSLRTLTVREMARLQSFPDWFVFKSKITTGGKERRFEVPQYTQVGNAVPPLLANHLGGTVFKLLI